MKILITGGSGFIGTNLVRFLLNQTEHEIVNVDKHTYAANPMSLADVAASPRYRFLQGDIADSAFVNEAVASCDPDALMHLAAESHVDRSIDAPGQFVQTNVVGTFNLLTATKDHFGTLTDSRKSTFRFLHISTDEVYGSLGVTGLFTESTRYDPHSPYSATKAAADHLARSWHTTYGLPVIVTNCSNNYGPYQFPEKLLPLMIIKCLSDDPLPVYGKGENVRDWLHVDDHVAALHRILNHGVPGHTYNIGGDCQRKNIDLIHSLCQIMDQLRPRSDGKSYRDQIEFVADRPGHDFRYAIDCSKLKRELDWKPQHSIDAGLEKTARWYIENETWWQSILNDTYQLQRLGSQATPSQLPSTPGTQS